MAHKNPLFTDADTIDIVGRRKGGGLDFVISVTGPIDESTATLRELEDKIRAYLAGAKSEGLLKHYGQRPGAAVVIYISCAYTIAEAALALIENMKLVASRQGIGLEVRTQMEDLH